MLRFAINLIYPLNFELLSERLFEYHHINQYQLDLLKVSPPLPSLVTIQLTPSILRSAAFWFPKQTQAQDNNNDPTYIFQLLQNHPLKDTFLVESMIAHHDEQLYLSSFQPRAFHLLKNVGTF